ncbi:MAG: RNA polymerase sigma factor [Bacteroidales bacterium]|nr:RNA polymerase sigma factor [Bacteroidales bacterium]
MGSEEFKSIWFPLSGRFYRVAFYILESQEDAEDAVQDLFSKLWKMRGSLGSVKNPLAFGITVIRNICLDKVRSKMASRTVNPAPEVFESVPDHDKDLSRSLIGKENLEKIRVCMARLPDKQRDVLEMRVFEELSFKEIADRTGMSEVNVRVKLSNARKNLKRMIEHEDN